MTHLDTIKSKADLQSLSNIPHFWLLSDAAKMASLALFIPNPQMGLWSSLVCQLCSHNHQRCSLRNTTGGTIVNRNSHLSEAFPRNIPAVLVQEGCKTIITNYQQDRCCMDNISFSWGIVQLNRLKNLRQWPYGDGWLKKDIRISFLEF